MMRCAKNDSGSILLLGANEMCHISAKKKKRKNAARIFFHNRFQAWKSGSHLVCLAACWHDRVRGQAFAVSRIALPQRPTIKRPGEKCSPNKNESQPSHTSYPLLGVLAQCHFWLKVQEQQLRFPLSGFHPESYSKVEEESPFYYKGWKIHFNEIKMKSSDTGSSFQWNYWPKSLTTRASKLAEVTILL